VSDLLAWPVPLVVQRRSSFDAASALVGDLAGAARRAGAWLAEAYAAVERRSASATGGQVDTYLSATPVIGAIVARLAEDRDLTAAASVRLVDDITFTRAFVDTTLRSKEPDEASIEATVDAAIERADEIRGFVDREHDTIYVHEERARAATVIHEALHLYSSPELRARGGRALDEGTTELFTREVCSANAILREETYPRELAAVRRLVGRLPGGLSRLAEAYFDGEPGLLRLAFEAPPGHDLGSETAAVRLRRWSRHLRDGDYAAADALLD